MNQATPVCRIEDLDDPGSRGFSVQHDNETVDGFVVLKDGELHAYRNSCPHTGSPLDWVEHQFLDLDQVFIQCSVHDARFDIASGECIAGPCIGDHLQSLPVVVRENLVFLADDE